MSGGIPPPLPPLPPPPLPVFGAILTPEEGAIGPSDMGRIVGLAEKTTDGKFAEGLGRFADFEGTGADEGVAEAVGANLGAGGSIAFEGAEIGCAMEGATVITFVDVGEEEFGAASDIGRIESFKSEAREDACGREAVAWATTVETG